MTRITWLGHSTFLLEIDGTKILVDPWITNPLKPETQPDYGDVELIVVTHGHSDHLGEAVELMKNNKKAKLVAIFEIANHVQQQGIEADKVIGGNIGGPINTGVNDIKVALTPATHSSTVGFPTGAVIIGKETTIYHAGDTGVMMDMQLIGEIYHPDVALLPIGGHFTMDPKEAAYAVKLLKPKVAIPMHYGSFPVLYGKPEEFEREVKRLHPETKVVILKPGESFTL